MGRFPGFPIYTPKNFPHLTKLYILTAHASHKLTSHISYRAVFKSKKHISVHNTISIPFFKPPHTQNQLPFNGVIGLVSLHALCVSVYEVGPPLSDRPITDGVTKLS